MRTKLTFILLFFIIISSAQNTVYVDVNATSGANDGTSWANAYTSLNDAFVFPAILANDEVWIAQGTYRLANQSDSYLLNTSQNDVKIYGGFNGTETALSQRDFRVNETIISGDVDGDDDLTLTNFRSDNAYNVFVIAANNILIDGVTITGGHANGSLSENQNGAAIYKNNTAVNLEVKNCKIIRNYAEISSAGIFAWASANNSLNVTNCIFESNEANFGTGIYSVTISGTPVFNINVYNNLFRFNKTSNRAGGFAGSSLWFRSLSSGSTINANIINNTIYGNADPKDFTSAGNSIDSGPVGIEKNGGANIFTNFKNNIIYNNSGENGGRSKPISSFINNNIGGLTISNNVTNSFFGSFFPSPNIFGNLENVSNTTPVFQDFANGDYTLTNNSVAFEFGDNTALPNTITEDLNGNPRIDGNNIDAGAFEFILPPPRVIYVDIDATGTNDGTTWARAFTNLNDAIANATANLADQIWIAEGTYTIPPNTDAVAFRINKNGVQLYGGFDGTETQLSQRDFNLNKTRLSGDRNNDDSNLDFFGDPTRDENVFSVVRIEAENTLLDGLTISNGTAVGTFANANGAGIFKQEDIATLNIANCIIEKNIANGGGAGLVARFLNTGSSTGNVSITNTTFNRNLSIIGGAIYAYTDTGGGTINFTVANSLFIDNLIRDNNTVASPIQAYAGSSGSFRTLAANTTLNLNLINNTYSRNIDSGTQNTMTPNTRSTIGLGQLAGNLNTQVSNSIFYGNLSSPGNSNFITATSLSEMLETNIGSVSVTNSLDEDDFSEINTANVSSSLSSDPLFVDTSNTSDLTLNDYSLQSGSPAINVGNNADVIGDTDLFGNQRIFNSTVDMGAYEFGATTLGVEDFASKNLKLKLYPNPVSNFLNVSFNSQIENLEIYSITGKLVLKSKLSTLNVSNLKKGIYILTITTEQGFLSSKFIKN